MDHSQYMEHGMCFIWDPPLVWLHVISDILTGIAYYSIAVAMVYFVSKRRDIPFLKVFLLFALFILACGTTHFFAVYTIYVPAYWYEGFVKALTAVVSVVAVFYFIPMIPQAIEMPSLTRTLRDLEISANALRESEEQYRSVIENIRDVFYRTDANDIIVMSSPSGAPLLGFETSDMLVGRSIVDFWADPGERTKMLQLIENQGSVVDFRTYFKKADGTPIPVSLTAAFRKGKDGSILGVEGIARDISERVRAEEEKERLQSQLLQAQKMESVGRLAGGVAHDYNNMLAVIFISLDLVKSQLKPGDPALESVLDIEKAAIRSRDITHQLLAFSRKQLIAPKQTNPNSLISDIGKALARLIGEDVELRFSLDPSVGHILIDPSQFDQILINLAVNARDAMPNGGKLTIETSNIDFDEDYCREHAGFKPGQYVRLGISDNGAGMDKETLSQVFEPFYTTKELGKGTGLGLATIYGIVRQNNGFIDVYSEPGQGSSFRIYFPRMGYDLPVAQSAEAPGNTPKGQEAILVVEDDEILCRTTQKTLEALGYSVTAVGNPEEALAVIRNSTVKFDLLLTDVVMPAINGAELRDKVLQEQPAIKVLFMSGYTSNAIVHRGVLDEGVDFIQKPFSIHDLSTKIRSILDSRSS